MNTLVPVCFVTCGHQWECVHCYGECKVCIPTNAFARVFSREYTWVRAQAEACQAGSNWFGSTHQCKNIWASMSTSPMCEPQARHGLVEAYFDGTTARGSGQVVSRAEPIFLSLELQPYIFTWTANTDKNLKPNIALTNL